MRPFLADYHVHIEKEPYTSRWLERFVAVACQVCRFVQRVREEVPLAQVTGNK